MQVVDLSQSGPDWHKWRSEGLGGSDAPALMGENTFQCADELLSAKLGKRQVRETAAMRRGKKLEPIARERYMLMTGIRCRPVCVIHDTFKWFRASLDGLSEDNQIVLEIKCPSSPKGHYMALDGKVPSYYRAQVQHQLGVTGCPALHFFSYTDSPEFAPHEQCALVKVLPDPEYIDRLIQRERLYWERLQREREFHEQA